MEKYFCNCLNLIIHVNNNDTREAEGKDFLSDELKEERGENLDPFFNSQLLDVKLAISGIEVVRIHNCAAPC